MFCRLSGFEEIIESLINEGFGSSPDYCSSHLGETVTVTMAKKCNLGDVE